MSAFEQTKETMMLVITMFVVIFVSVMFYIFLGNFQIGSGVDVSEKEAELVVLRTLKCFENNEKLDDCIKSEKYGIKLIIDEKESYLNEGLYNRLKDSNSFVYLHAFRVKDKFLKIFVRFKNE